MILWDHEGCEVDKEYDATSLTLTASIAFGSVLPDDAAVRMRDEDDLLALLGKPPDNRNQGLDIVREGLGRRLGPHRGILAGLAGPAPRLQTLPHDVEAVGAVPTTGREDEGEIGLRHSLPLCVSTAQVEEAPRVEMCLEKLGLESCAES